MKAPSVLKLVLTLFFALLVETAHAQDTVGYFFFAPGGQGTSRAYAAGGGIQEVLKPHFWVGGELSGITPVKGKVSDNVVGVFSLNAYVPIRGAGHRLDPFATFGYSLLFLRLYCKRSQLWSWNELLVFEQLGASC